MIERGRTVVSGFNGVGKSKKWSIRGKSGGGGCGLRTICRAPGELVLAGLACDDACSSES